jgi:hypothetical protein
MNATGDKGLAPRLADLIVCLVRDHAWQTTDIPTGASSLLSTDCARCGQAGPIHGTEQQAGESER